MVILDLIRHARTQWNLEKKLQGRKDMPLSPTGRKDGKIWAKKIADQEYDRIFTSPMCRACETADLLASNTQIPIKVLDDLKEQDFGEWEGRSIQELRNVFPGLVESEEKKGWLFHPPEGESREQLLKRVLPAVKKVCRENKGKKILIVSHSSVMKILIYHILNRRFLPGEKPKMHSYYLHRVLWEDDGFHKVEMNKLALLG